MYYRSIRTSRADGRVILSKNFETMSFIKFYILTAVSLVLCVDTTFATHKQTDTCTISQKGESACIGPGTTEVTEYARFYLGSTENYAVGWHPCGVIALTKVNLPGTTGINRKMRINGIYAYINKVDGDFYYFPTVGCEKPQILTDSNDYLPGLDDLTNKELLKIVIHLTDGYPYDTACNTIPFKNLIGPAPNVPADVPGANMYIDISNLQSAHIVSYNATGEELAKYLRKVATGRGDRIGITSDKNNVILSGITPPVVRKCKRKVFALVDPTKGKYPEISSLKRNSGCFWSTLLVEQLTSLIVDRQIYVYWSIKKEDNSGVFFFEGYIQQLAFDYIFDPLYYSYC